MQTARRFYDAFSGPNRPLVVFRAYGGSDCNGVFDDSRGARQDNFRSIQLFESEDFFSMEYFCDSR